MPSNSISSQPALVNIIDSTHSKLANQYVNTKNRIAEKKIIFCFITPPAQRASIATQCCSPAGPPSLRDGFLRGGLKGNDQKKYTQEVKTVKAIM